MKNVYCKNCNRIINVESTKCPICGAGLIENVSYIKTSGGTRVVAIIMSILAIAFICGSWAEVEAWSFFGTYQEKFSVFELRDIFDFIGINIERGIFVKYKNIFDLAYFSALISIVLHICSALCALINAKSSKSVRVMAVLATFATILITRVGVGMLENDTENIVQSTWTWVVLGIIVFIDILFVADKVGINKIDYSKCGDVFNKPNTPNESLLERGGWKCARCSKINASYVNTCSCGEIKKTQDTHK